MVFPKTTPAAILVEQKRDLVLANCYLPDALEYGQVLVELAYSGICGSQIGEIEGAKGKDKWLPHMLGHEGSGKVLSTGPGVTRFKQGDQVIAHWRKASGIESNPPKYQWNNKTVNAGWVTTFNKYSIISENRLTRLPTGCDLKSATLFGCAIPTAYGTIDNVAKLKLGDNIVIYGAGGVGLSIIEAANLAGARKIIAVDKFDNRLDLAGQCGATDCINSFKESVEEKIPQILQGLSPDVFIDNTGVPEIIRLGYELIKPDGKIILVGVPAVERDTTLYTLDLHFGKIIIGSHGGESNPHIDIPKYFSLVKSRKIKFEKIITEVAPLDNINKLITTIKNGDSAGRCVVDFKYS